MSRRASLSRTNNNVPGRRRRGKLGRFVLLNRRRFDLTERVTILGATLFSRITDEQRGTASLFVSDFSNITGWNVDRHNAARAADLAWLNHEVTAIGREKEAKGGAIMTSGLDKPERRSIVILTHYSQTYLPGANDPDQSGDGRGVQVAFATDLSAEPYWTSPDVKLWALGHTHFSCDFVDEGGKGLRATGSWLTSEDTGVKTRLTLIRTS